jgi:hypothetical protein
LAPHYLKFPSRTLPMFYMFLGLRSG